MEINPFNNYAGGNQLQMVGSSSILTEIDDSVFFGVWDWTNDSGRDNSLYYAPIEIKIKKDSDTTLIQTYGDNVSNFPYGNLSIAIYTGENLVQNIYGDYSLVNNINELVTQLNADNKLSFLGTYSVNEAVENGIILTMTTSIKNQFSPNNTLTFNIFND